MGVVMLRKTFVAGCVASILFAGALGIDAIAAKGPATVLVIPARQRVVTLVQDVYKLRTLSVVCYQGAVDAAEPLIHKWDGNAWQKVTIDDFRATLPERVVLVGNAKSLPAALVDAASRCENTSKIETFDTTTITAELAKLLDFNTREISWLAKRNALTVVDKNEDRRRYGRYGKPGSERAPVATERTTPETVIIPPEPEIEPVEPVGSMIEPEPVVAPSKEVVAEVAPAPAKPRYEKAPEDK